MNRIEKLIKEKCPDGVRYTKLGQISNLIRGRVISKNYVNEHSGCYPVYSSQTSNNGEFGRIDTYMFDGDYVTWTTDGAYAGTIFRRTGKFNITNICGLIDLNNECITTDFLYYWLSINTEKYVNRATDNPKLMSNVMETVEIPLPPLSIQQEIVEILDSFTALQQNLEDELKLRQKQYEHYCDTLYGSDYEGMMNMDGVDETKVVTFDDLGTITRGKRFVRDDVREEGQPCIHYGDMYTYYGTKASKAKTYLDRDFPKKMRYANKGDVVIVGAGENNYDIGVGLVWMGDEPAAVHDACYILEHNINPMYISYYLRSNIYHLQLKKYVSEGKICSFSGKDLGRIKIPVQSSEKQSQIVQTLDHFESLISNIKTEIELRKKQYEYYREKLLTF